MPTVATPTPLHSYPSSSTAGIFIFPLGLVFDKAIHDPSVLRFEFLIDTYPTFSSPNVIHVFSNGSQVVDFQNGPLGKAVEVQLPKRSPDADTVWYWKARINGYGYGGGYVSEWTNTLTLTVPKNQTLDITQAMWDDVADENSYSKAANSANLYKILNMIGKELDQALLENEYTRRDLSLEQSRDTALQNNFGDLVELSTVATEPAVSYRWKVRELFKAFINNPGAVEGIKRVVKAFVGEEPVILDATNIQGWILPINAIYDPNHPNVTDPPPIVLYSTNDMGFHWGLKIWNSWNLTYDSSVLEDYVNKIKPAHTNTTFTYVSQRHVQIRYDTADDWNSMSLTNLTVNDSGGLTLSGSNTTGNAVSEVIYVEDLDSWDMLELDQVLSGQTLTYSIRSAPTASGTWTAYEDVGAGGVPSSTPLQDYLQIKISFSTTDSNYKPILNGLRQNLLRT